MKRVYDMSTGRLVESGSPAIQAPATRMIPPAEDIPTVEPGLQEVQATSTKEQRLPHDLANVDPAIFLRYFD
ncbi:MAG: hypothetical protein M3H12_20975 [Chromatiales bacterium]|uniref:hypothetical protein n=1 Tax=endosymbiont of Lamellibrachia barhami TaxID=205975 RepID=UPI0015AE37FE|nr:hypothetical protein [endosymbiont of Lamellibrachia barhami]MBA1446841.1 hypothetical protein [Gammaproteobacteria bacterium]